jgi:epsilon-lactone hydrolase
MLTDNPAELRSAAPSLLMRAVKWLVAHRTPIFPTSPEAVDGFLHGRKTPRDAPMPNGFNQRFVAERWHAAGQEIVTLHPRSGPGAWHMLYFHGGGFVLPLFKEHWALIAAMIDRCGISVSVPLYDLVPEASWQAQDDVADEAFARLAARHDPRSGADHPQW